MSQGFCSPVINTVRVSVGVSVDAGGAGGEGAEAGAAGNRTAAVQANLPEPEYQPKNSRRRMRRARWSPHPGKAKKREQRDS